MRRTKWIWAAQTVAVPLIVWNWLSLGAAVPPARLLLAAVLCVPGYLTGRWLAGLRPLLLIGALAVLVIPLFTREAWSVVDALIALAVSILGPWAIGRYRRQHVALVEAGWARATQLEREQAQIAVEAELRERQRIAYEMHDSLGHDLSLIALQAGALELAADLPEPHRAAAATLRRNAVAATEELRGILGVLRTTPPTAAGFQVAALVARAAEAGAHITLTPADTDCADPDVHRVVQESITNALKHSPGAPISVRLDGRTVTVHNGPPASPPPGTDGRGQGLLGLRERVRLTGGTFHATPLPDGGFEVVAKFQERP